VGVGNFIGGTSRDYCWFETKSMMKIGKILRLRINNERTVRANIEHFAKGLVFTISRGEIERFVGVCGTSHLRFMF